MLKVENYPKAYKEVYVILNNMNKEDMELVPVEFVEMLKERMSKEYQFEIKEDEDFDNKEILRETQAILAYMYLNYWGTDEERKIIKAKFAQDIKKEEIEKREKYNPNDTFKDKYQNHIEEKSLIQYNNKGFVYKIISRIKDLLGHIKRKDEQ